MSARGRRSFAVTLLLAIVVGTFCATAGLGDTLGDTFRSDVDLSSKEIASRETALGDLIADAVRASVKCDAAFVAADYFNEIQLPKGSLTGADVLKALVIPGDEISVVKLTGDQIQRAMEFSLFLYPKPNSGFLQVSNMTVTFRPDANADKRIVSIKINGDALETTKTYLVAMPTPLAKGGLAYFKFWKPSDIEKDTYKSTDKPKTLHVAVLAYIAEHKTFTKGEDRLIAKGK